MCIRDSHDQIHLSQDGRVTDRQAGLAELGDDHGTSVQDAASPGKSVRGLTGSSPRWERGAMSRRVLIVDDEPRVREIAASYLQREGFDVREASDGDDARRHLGEFKPDLVILDVMFPGASGLVLLAEIRRAEPSLPVIMLTARAEESDRVAGLEMGA